MKIKKHIIILVIISIMTLMTVGCTTVDNKYYNEREKQEQVKKEQVTNIMKQVEIPVITRSIDRENIREKIIQTNNPNMLQWVYPMSAGRVIGRFPVRGKVTSGSRRLTRSEDSNGIELPDELGTYSGGEGNAYIFWFDPANQIHQFKGDYFLSPVPYRFDVGLGTITTEIDITEEAKKGLYDKQTAEVGGKN